MRAVVECVSQDGYRFDALHLSYVPQDYEFFGLLRGIRFSEPDPGRVPSLRSWLTLREPKSWLHPYRCCVLARLNDAECETPHPWLAALDCDEDTREALKYYDCAPGIIGRPALVQLAHELRYAYPLAHTRPWLEALLVFMHALEMERGDAETRLVFGFDC